MNPQRDRLPGLDFLRACAILLVITWHFPPAFWPFGFRPATWAGVDLFFVLSGYLIGTQLLRPYTQQRVPSYRQFFLRRACRVLPAYFAVLGIYWLVPAFREQPRLAPLWRFLTFTLNFGLDAGKTGAFSHAWSLCVEEHFYLLLPLIVFALMRWSTPRRTLQIAAGIVLGGMILRACLWLHYVAPMVADHDPRLRPKFLTYIYYPTYNRLDGLLVGVLIAALKLFRPEAWQKVAARGNLALGGGAAVLLAAFWICQSMQSFATSVVGYPLLALGFGLMVVAALSGTSVLSHRRSFGMTAIACLSYSVYLTHKEIMHLDDVYLHGWMMQTGVFRMLIYLVTFYLAGQVLYTVVERQGFRLRDRLLSRV